jgi:mRNA interferase RelE/StbE
MSKYIVVLTKKAEKILDRLSDHIAEPIHNAIIALEENPRPIGYKKLRGRNAYRIRTGDYRIIYEIIDNKLIINIVTIGHRKDIYRN